MRELERNSTNAAGVRAGIVSLPALVVVGPGRAGTAIARAARAAGLEARTAGRDDARVAAAGAELVLLCVPDGEIAAAAGVARAATPPPRFLGHSSGAVGLDALGLPAAETRTFGLHPLQTLPDGEADLAGAGCAVSGSDGEALELARALAQRLGMRPFAVAEEQRAAYHAAASMASNFLVTLEERAAGLLDATGIEDGRELLAPLVLRTAANWASHGGGALTGPIARGDEATVARHREALATAAPRLLALYDELAAQTRELATERVT